MRMIISLSRLYARAELDFSESYAVSMLTRCKKGMIICTDREFVEGVASDTLITELAKALGDGAWVPWKSVLQPNYHPFPV